MDRRRTRTRPKRYEETTSIGGQTATAIGSTTAASAGGGKRGSSISQVSAASTQRLSPTRTRASPPVRRSSRPRSSASSATITITPVIPPSPIKEVKEPKSSPKQRVGARAAVNKTPPTTVAASTYSANSANTTNTYTTSTSSGNANAMTTSSSTTVRSSTYSSTTTQKTVEIHGGSGVGVGGLRSLDSEISKLSAFIRRSVSPLTGVLGGGGRRSNTPTEAETYSRYSRSASRSLYGDDRYSRAEFSDNEQDKLTNIDEDEEAELEEDIDDDQFDGSHGQYKSFSYNANAPLQRPATSTSSSVLLCRKLAAPQEYGGRWGVLALLLLVPCAVYYLQWCCSGTENKDSSFTCTLRKPNLSALLDVQQTLRRVFPLPAVGAYVGALLGVFVLSALLPGKHVRLPLERGNLVYKFNAAALALLASIALAVAERQLQYNVVAFVLRHQLRFCVYGLLSAFVLALWAYVRSGDWLSHKLRADNNDQLLLNEYGKTGRWLIDYAQGRQINPKWLGGEVELKLVCYRFAWLSTLLYAQCCVYSTLQWPAGLLAALTEAVATTPSPLACAQQLWLLLAGHAARVQYDGAALLSAVMLLLYSADALLFEHHLGSSFELQGEGFGCLLLLRYAATPYLLSAVARYYHAVQPNAAIGCQWSVYGPLVLLLAGVALKRFSNALKYQYRLKPLLPIFAGIETIHTFQGRRLLLGALWGRVRQPNYAGDVVALIALALPLALRFAWPPLLCVLIVIAGLLHRATRVNARNLARYHSSWVRYCSQVRHYILPKVY